MLINIFNYPIKHFVCCRSTWEIWYAFEIWLYYGNFWWL